MTIIDMAAISDSTYVGLSKSCILPIQLGAIFPGGATVPYGTHFRFRFEFQKSAPMMLIKIFKISCARFHVDLMIHFFPSVETEMDFFCVVFYHLFGHRPRCHLILGIVSGKCHSQADHAKK
jgi:hypothetical protein